MMRRKVQKMMMRWMGAALGSLVVCGLIGCGGDDAAKKDADAMQDADKSTANMPERARNKNLVQKGLTVTSADLDRDGKPDQWTMTGAGGKMLRMERDLNFDGTVDMWQYPGAAGAVMEEEMDLDHDGRVDVVAYYREDGSLERKELALEFDLVFTLFKYYDAAGSLLRVEHDEDGDKVIDRWDYYEKERVVRTGWDSNRDGIPDKFDNL